MAINDTDNIFVDRDYRFATVVDRTGLGGAIPVTGGGAIPGEFLYGGEVWAIKKKFQLRAPLVLHVFNHSTATYIHADDGAGGTMFVNRLGIEEAPSDLLEQLSPEAIDTSPLTPITTRVELWNSDDADPDRKSAVVKTARITQEMRGRDGSGPRAGHA